MLDVRREEDIDNLVRQCNVFLHLFDCDALTLGVYPLLFAVKHPYGASGLSQEDGSARIKQALVCDPMAC